MAQLVACRTCNHKMSSNAERCPSCGEFGKGRVSNQRMALGIIALVFVLFLLFAGGNL
jgi:hypothetical protein